MTLPPKNKTMKTANIFSLLFFRVGRGGNYIIEFLYRMYPDNNFILEFSIQNKCHWGNLHIKKNHTLRDNSTFYQKLC